MGRLTRFRRSIKTAARIRWWLTVCVVVLMVGTVVAIVGTALRAWTFGMGHADLPTRIGAVVSVCAFILVAVTLIVALLAYLAATGLPDLQPELKFWTSPMNEPILQASPEAPDDNGCRKVSNTRQTECQVALRNRSRYSGRNPGIRIELDGLGGLAEQPGWTTVVWANMIQLTAFQWDGGADYLIHGRWHRQLPALNFDGLYELRRDPPPALLVTVAADGLEPARHVLPVRILDYDEYMAYTARLGAEQAAT